MNRETFGKPRKRCKRASCAQLGQDGPTLSDEPGRQTPDTPSPYRSLISERSWRDRESSYREVKETLSVTGSP